jgi:hypothetical protein
MPIEKHITVLGILHIVMSSFALLAGIIILVIFSGVGVLLTQVDSVDAMEGQAAAGIIFLLGTLLAGLLLLISVPGIVAGIGLLRRKEWSRILAIILGFLNLLNFPLGTALGIYTLWVLFKPEAIEYLRKPAA